MITDFHIWTDCYATMAAILAAQNPDKAPQLFAYLRTITRASRNFDSAAWVSYDMHGIPQTSSQLGLPGLGVCRYCTVQRGIHRQGKDHNKMLLLPIQHTQLSGVPVCNSRGERARGQAAIGGKNGLPSG